jgi:hypothetical protein
VARRSIQSKGNVYFGGCRPLAANRGPNDQCIIAFPLAWVQYYYHSINTPGHWEEFSSAIVALTPRMQRSSWQIAYRPGWRPFLCCSWASAVLLLGDSNAPCRSTLRCSTIICTTVNLYQSPPRFRIDINTKIQRNVPKIQPRTRFNPPPRLSDYPLGFLGLKHTCSATKV